MANKDYKNGKLVEIIREFNHTGATRYEINGINQAIAVPFWRIAEEKFNVIPKGSYKFINESGNNYLEITDNTILEQATQFQICYVYSQISSKYIEEFPELSVMVNKYNELVDDATKLFSYLKSVGMTSDTLQLTKVLSQLEPLTTWFMDNDGEIKTLPISDLYGKFQQMINALEKVLDEYIEQKKEEIRGPAGAIDNVTASVNSNAGIPKVTVLLSGTPERRNIDLKFENLKGDKPIKGEDYLTPAEKEQFTNDTKAIVQAEGTKVIEQVKTIVAGNPATTNALTLSGKTRVEFENDTNKNKADLNYGFAVITDELCLPPILPPSSETGQIIELSDSKTGYFYWDRDNKVSWQNSDLGYRTKVIRVNEGEKYRLKCTLNGGVPVYVLSSTDYTTLPGLNSAIQVFPKRQLSGKETFDVVVTIPKFVEFLSFGYIANQEAKMIKFKIPSEPTLKTRVLNCEDDIVETNKRIDETNKRIDGLNPGETPIEPPKIAKDIVKYYLNNVVCVGDSLTAGYYHDGSKYLVAKENYPFYLKKILNCKIVDNYSESGYTSKDWYRKFSSKVQWANYDTVIIWLGTNGGLSDTVENDTANGFADTYTGHYCHIIDDAIKANPNIRIFLGTVFAVGGGSVSDKAGTNAVINKIATKYSSNVLGVVDNDNGELYLGENQNLYHPFYKFNGDMLHFGKVGNLHLAKHYVDEICKIIEKDESKMEVLFNELN